MRTARIFTRALIGLCAVLLYAAAITATAQVVIHGEGDARNCYLKVLHGDPGRFATRKACIMATNNPALRRKDLAATYVNTGILHMRAEKYREARQWYQKALKLQPQMPEVYINQSVISLHENQPREAIQSINMALELDTGKKPEAFFNRSIAYDRLGDYTQAYKDLTHALTLRPDWPPALRAISFYEVAPKPSDP